MSSRPRIALFTEKPERGGGALRAAIEVRGFDCVPLSLGDCGFDIGGTPHGLLLPGFGDGLPNAAVVRFVPGGSFEEVTARLGILHALDCLGVPVCNAPTAIERCVDKAATSFHLAHCGLPTPRTWVRDDVEAAAAVVRDEADPDSPLVLKPLFGAQGRGLRLLGRPEDLPDAEAVGGVFYMQRHVGPPPTGTGEVWRDMRVLVCDGRAIAAMVRSGRSWITNIRQGGRAEAARADGPAAELAIAAARAVGAVLAGIDLIRGAGGDWQILEVNSMPAWSGLQQVQPFDIAARVAEGLLRASGLKARVDG